MLLSRKSPALTREAVRMLTSKASSAFDSGILHDQAQLGIAVKDK